MNGQQVNAPIEKIIDNPHQSKERDYSDIEEFALGIAEFGLLNKPNAKAENGHFVLKEGHRRKRGFQWLKANWKARGLTNRYDGYTYMPLEVGTFSDDDMFDHMVVENVHRKDLKAMEKSRLLHQYKERHPEATSKQMGLVFNMKDSTVRVVMSYTKLPTEAQKALDDGDISEGTARSLLSMQKVAPTAVIKVLEEIEDDKKDTENSRWGGLRTQEEIVLDLLSDQPEVKELWWDSRGKEKPRAGGSDSWLLDAKNFPNHYLPALTHVDAAAALGVQDDQATLGLIGGLLGYSPITNNDVDEVKQSANFQELVEINPQHGAKLVHLLNPPACSSCPFYTTLRGTHYCGMRTCFERKSSAWNRESLHKASKSLGIAIYDAEADGAFRVLTDTHWSDSTKDRELFKKRSKDLRLAFMADIDRKKDQNGYDGVPKGSVVLAVGKAMQELQEKKQEARVEKDRTHEVDELVRKQRHSLAWHVTEYLTTMFDGINEHALQVVKETYGFKWSHHAVNDVDMEDVPEDDHYDRRMLALMMVMEAEQGPWNQTCVKYAEGLVATAKTWGVKIPARFLKLAEQADAEIKELKKSVAAETKGKKK